MIDPQRNRIIIITAGSSILAGIVVMLGWIFNIRELRHIVPGLVSMAFNTAFCFVLFGVALPLTHSAARKNRNIAYFILSITSTLVGLVTLLQFLFHFNSGLDELFVRDNAPISRDHLFAGRMAFNAALNVLLLGLAFLMLWPKKRLCDRIAQYLFHAVTIISSVALIGYLYGVSIFNSLLYVNSMAIHTALLFFILSVAGALLNPSIGIARLFAGKQIGNQLAKRIFMLMIAMVVAIGSLKVQRQHYQLFSADIGLPLVAVGFLLVSLVFIWNTATWLNKIDSRRSEAEEEVKLMNADLEKRVQERWTECQKSEEKYRSLIEHASDAIYILDREGNFADVNASMCQMTGYTRDELLRLNVAQIVDPEELKTDPLPKGTEIPGALGVRERRFIGKDRRVFPVEINVKVFSGDKILVMARDIAYRKKMETELRDAELKFRTLAEKSIVGFYIVQHNRFIYVNPRFANVFGYRPEELIGRVPIEVVFHESYKGIATENVRKRISGEVESIHYEAKGQRKDGSDNWVEYYGSRAIIGNEITIIGSMVDVTERKQAEEELKASERKYKFLFDSNPSPLWMIAKDDLSIIAVNDAAAKMYGYSKDELLQMNVTSIRVGQDSEGQRVEYEEDLTATENRILRHRKKDGTVMHVQVNAHDIIFNGRPVRLSLTNDITKRLIAEESLHKSEANLQSILKTTDTIFGLFDLDMRALAFNERAIEFVKEQFHHIPEKGDLISDFFPADRFPQLKGYIMEVFQGRHINYEIGYPQAGGLVRWYDVRLSPIASDDKKILGMLTALYDVTERKNTEQDLKSAYERIQSHINSIKAMAWKQSHLIRSPLANLKALAEILIHHPEDTKAFSHFQTELNRLDSIIHEMAQEASEYEN
jgi:two-component system, sporulation sensor kinase E